MTLLGFYSDFSRILLDLRDFTRTTTTTTTLITTITTTTTTTTITTTITTTNTTITIFLSNYGVPWGSPGETRFSGIFTDFQDFLLLLKLVKTTTD